MAILTRILPLVLLTLTVACRSGQEQWGPFGGQVIDAQTGTPIAGAHVMVLWIREPPSVHMRQRFYDAQESTTNQDGRFEIPRERRFLTVFVGAPELSVFAAGYQMQASQVDPAGGRRYVEPTVIPMRPLKTREERCEGLRLWSGPSIGAASGAPRFMAALRGYALGLDCRRPEGR